MLRNSLFIWILCQNTKNRHKKQRNYTIKKNGQLKKYLFIIKEKENSVFQIWGDYMKNKEKASVSIFLCSIFMILIVFTCTIIDFTRIQIAKGQAERRLLIGAHSMLGAYNSQLQNQYGIFGRDFTDISATEQEILEYMKPANSSLTNHDTQSVSLIKTYTINNPTYIKLQILEYMKLRAPFLAIEPFLDKYEIFAKGAKTSEIIDNKNKIVSEIDGIEDCFIKLQGYIEGIIINDQKSLLQLKNNKAKLYERYLKKIFVEGKEVKLYHENEIPDTALREQLNNNIWDLDRDINKYKKCLSDQEDCIRAGYFKYLKIIEAQKDITELKKRLAGLSRESESYTEKSRSIKKKISKRKNEIKTLEKEMLIEIISFEEMDGWIYKTFLPELQLLYKDGSNLEMSYKSIAAEAVKEIELIEEKSKIIADKIDMFKLELENKEGKYVQQACTEVAKEIVEYEKLLAINSSGEMEMVNDILKMKQTITNNEEVLSSVSKNIECLYAFRQGIYSNWFTNIVEKNNRNQFFTYFSKTFKENYKEEKAILINTACKEIDIIEEKMNGYSRKLYFKYPSVNKDDSLLLDTVIANAESILPSFLTEKEGLLIDKERLPSNAIKSLKQETSKLENISIEENSKILKKLTGISDAIEQGLCELRNEIYVNEYIAGMFRDACSAEEEDMTLAGFSKSEHKLKYEIEYILLGNPVDEMNLAGVLGIIFSIRVAMNSLSILMDNDKMNIITNMANSMAGWWSLGIGSIVIIALLTLAWAAIESAEDIKLLLNNKSVPVFKDGDSFSTDIFGKIKNTVTEDTKKEYTPSLSYHEYLKILLLAGIAGEEEKLLRILDLAQLNIEKERGEDIYLSELSSALEVKSEGHIKYLFFSLPFMPQKLKNNNEYRLTNKLILSY